MAWCSRITASALSRICCNLACADHPGGVLETKGNWACALLAPPAQGGEVDAEARRQGRPAACAARPGRGASLPLMGIDPMKLGEAGCCEFNAEHRFFWASEWAPFQMHKGMQRMKKAPPFGGAF